MSKSYIERSVGAWRSPGMMPNDYSEFLREMAESLRQLAERAPDIGQELRRFAEDIDQMIAQATRRDEAEGTA